MKPAIVGLEDIDTLIVEAGLPDGVIAPFRRGGLTSLEA